MYVAGRNAGTVDKVSDSGAVSAFYSGPLIGNIEGLALDGAGDLYVASSPNGGRDSIVKITPGGTASTFYAFGSPDIAPTGIAFDHSGNLFVASQAGINRGIQEITPSGSISVFADDTLLARAFGLVFDAYGNLYVANLGNQTIVKYTPGGVGSVFATMPAESNPCGLSIDAAGNLLVSFNNSAMIEKISPDGVTSTFYNGPLVGNSSVGIGVDAAGNVFEVTSGNEVIKVAPDGSSAQLFTTLNNFDGSTQFLALTGPAIPVPEPAACAAAAGTLAMAVVIWRRRSRAARYGRG